MLLPLLPCFLQLMVEFLYHIILTMSEGLLLSQRLLQLITFLLKCMASRQEVSLRRYRTGNLLWSLRDAFSLDGLLKPKEKLF